MLQHFVHGLMYAFELWCMHCIHREQQREKITIKEAKKTV